MQETTTRVRVHSCIRPDTYKYFVPQALCDGIWECLELEYGSAIEMPGFGLKQIETKDLLIRSGSQRNPITVIRKQKCPQERIAALHQLLQFYEHAETGGECCDD